MPNPDLNTITKITINGKDVERENLDDFLDTGFFMLILQNIMLNNEVKEPLNITIEHESRRLNAEDINDNDPEINIPHEVNLTGQK